MSSYPGIETFHPRASWEPSDLNMATDFTERPPTLWLPDVDRIACHYTAAINLPDGDPGETLNGIDGIRQLLASAHRDYLNNRRSGDGYTRRSDGHVFPGFPLGYSFAFDWLGGVWEIRGFDFKPAATGGHNGHTLAYLMLTDRADTAPPAMWASFRAMAREAQRRGAVALANRPWPHRKFLAETGVGTATACCGDALVAQINQGLGDLDHDTPLPGGNDDMDLLPIWRLDTRGPNGPNRDAYKLKANSTHTITIPNARGHRAAQITFTPVEPEAAGHLTAWPSGTRPNTSFANVIAGQPPDGRTLLVELDANGAFKLWTLPRTHIVIDFTGIVFK